MIQIIILSIVGILIVIGEIKFDLACWRKDKDDKPMSTYLRAAAFVLIASLVYIFTKDILNTLACLGYVVSVFWLLFDTTINIVRRKVISANFYKLPYNPYYRPFHSKLEYFAGLVGWAYASLSLKEKIYWTLTKIFHVIFYHGKDKSKWTFDWVFNNTPGVLEIMIKGTVYGIAFYYLNMF